MKILMVGNKESGKTTYMAGSFGVLEGGINNFFVDTDASSKKWFQRLFRSIKQGDYPNPTDKRQNYNLKLYHKRQKILDFEWVDYNGGVITEANVEKFKQDMDSSDGIMIFLEAHALWQNRPSVHKLRRIISLIQEHLENYDKPLLSVIIVLTKYDNIPVDVSFDEVTKNLQNFMTAVKDNKKIYARIVPISCTTNGFFNVELPLLDVLDSGLMIDYLTNIAAAQYYAEQANENRKKTGFIDELGSFITGNPTYREIAEAYVKMAQERIALIESLEKPIENLRQYISNYEIVFPNVERLSRTSTIVIPRRRFIEF